MRKQDAVSCGARLVGVLSILALMGAQMEGCLGAGRPVPDVPCGPVITGFNGGDLVTLDGSGSSGVGQTLSYAWTQLTGTLVVLSAPDAAVTTFTAPNVTELLTFQLTVTDPLGLTDTCVTAISIECIPTTITQQPVGQEVCPGDAATFTVAADSISDLTYQWQQRVAGGVDWNNLTNGGGISGADTPTLAVASVDTTDAGDYRCVVTSPCGIVTSSEAALSVGETTRIVTQPVDQSAYYEETVRFSVTASGSGLRYQWQLNGENITNDGSYSGATSRTLTITILGEKEFFGAYRCVVRGDCGSATSRAATLTLGGGGIGP